MNKCSLLQLNWRKHLKQFPFKNKDLKFITGINICNIAVPPDFWYLVPISNQISCLPPIKKIKTALPQDFRYFAAEICHSQCEHHLLSKIKLLIMLVAYLATHQILEPYIKITIGFLQI